MRRSMRRSRRVTRAYKRGLTGKQLANEFGQRLARAELVLPHSNDLVARAPKLQGEPPRTSGVRLYFAGPVRPVRLGHWPATLWTTVPEAAIDEDRQIPSWEDEVWEARDRAEVHFPAPNASADEGGAEFPFCRAVAFESDTAHPPASLFLRKNVHVVGPYKYR